MASLLKRKIPSVLILSVLSVATSTYAQSFSNVIVFGDSLSDGGIYGSRFTTNPGLTAAEYFAQSVGHTITTSTTGGTNYAQGGARVNSESLTTPAGFVQRPISTQVTEYLSNTGSSADPNAVYVIQGGANDIFQDLTKVQLGLMTPAEFQSSLISAGSNFAFQIVRLKAAGAKYVVVPNLPNLGVTPAFSGALSNTATTTSVGFNSIVQTALKQMGTDVIAVDNFSLINEVVADPSAYGFTNASTPACTTSSSITCSPSTLVTTDAANTYVFADGVHPTTAAQKLSAQYITSVVQAPTKISLLSATPLAGSASRLRSLDNNVAHAGQKMWHAFADYDYTRTRFDGAKSTGNSLLMGVDHAIGKGRLGLSAGYQKYIGSFDGRTKGFTMTEPSVGLYYQYGFGKDGMAGHVLASVSYGDLKLSNVNRSIQLGTATRIETGNTKGTHWAVGIAADITAGTFAQGKFSHGPTASLRFEDIKIKGYSESSNLSTAMTFEQQHRYGLLASLGYQIKGHMGNISPYAKISYELDGTRGSDVQAKVKSMYSSFSTPALEASDGFRAEIGTGITLSSNARLNFNLASTFGKKSGKELGFNVGVDAKF